MRVPRRERNDGKEGWAHHFKRSRRHIDGNESLVRFRTLPCNGVGGASEWSHRTATGEARRNMMRFEKGCTVV
jgi:hypothetical protein